MASASAPSSKLDEAKSTASTILWEVYHHRPRTQRAKAIALVALTLFLFLYMLSSSSRVSGFSPELADGDLSRSVTSIGDTRRIH